MECKFVENIGKINPDLRINRYIMECKSNYHSQCYTGFRELIDTLWNVNTIFQHIILLLQFELIDTLWNVNAVTRDLKIDAVSRINRYIMECK